ncbi:hypothetical protein FGF80_17365 [Natrinema pallidum]|uniref:Uncharacterized protein n=1 Tax=Natrinema pallidum TaxID=69527 RepID=A0A4P9TIT5_9EURY|nr:hypothetical protein FGF80_17365 [Natrinema pallidum]
MHLVEDTVVGFVVVIEISDFDLTAVGIATDDDASLGGVRHVLEIVLDDLSSEVLSPGVAGNDAVGIGSDLRPVGSSALCEFAERGCLREFAGEIPFFGAGEEFRLLRLRDPVRRGGHSRRPGGE